MYKVVAWSGQGAFFQVFEGSLEECEEVFTSNHGVYVDENQIEMELTIEEPDFFEGM